MAKLTQHYINSAKWHKANINIINIIIFTTMGYLLKTINIVGHEVFLGLEEDGMEVWQLPKYGHRIIFPTRKEAEEKQRQLALNNVGCAVVENNG